mgnify:CR=1 FL=1
MPAMEKIKEIRRLLTTIKAWPYWKIDIVAYTPEGNKMEYSNKQGKKPW